MVTLKRPPLLPLFPLSPTRRIAAIIAGVSVCLLTACQPVPDALPTVSTIQMAQTAVVLTQNAPPPGFRGAVSFPLLDDRLRKQPSWNGVLAMRFDGIDAAKKEATTAQIEVQIFRNELTGTRRVLFNARGEAFGVKLDETRSFEGVRISNDYYWVLQNPQGCAILKEDDQARRQIADLTAGSLVGGIKSAVPTGNKAQINGQNAWEYAFAPADVTLDVIHTDQIGKYTLAAGGLWVAPAADAIVRLSLTVNVEDVRLLEGDLPVTGQLRITYELKEVGVPYNITVPFGC